MKRFNKSPARTDVVKHSQYQSTSFNNFVILSSDIIHPPNPTLCIKGAYIVKEYISMHITSSVDHGICNYGSDQPVGDIVI